jgi:hypothetical protein
MSLQTRQNTSEYYLKELDLSLKIQTKLIKKFLKEINFNCKSFQSKANETLSFIYGFKNYHEMNTVYKNNPYDFRFDFVIIKSTIDNINKLMTKESILNQSSRLHTFLNITLEQSKIIILKLHSASSINELLHTDNYIIEFQKKDRLNRKPDLRNVFHVSLDNETNIKNHTHDTRVNFSNIKNLQNKDINSLKNELFKAKAKVLFFDKHLYLPNLCELELELIKNKIDFIKELNHLKLYINFENIVTLGFILEEIELQLDFASKGNKTEYNNYTWIDADIYLGRFESFIISNKIHPKPIQCRMIMCFSIDKRQIMSLNQVGVGISFTLCLFISLKLKFSNSRIGLILPKSLLNHVNDDLIKYFNTTDIFILHSPSQSSKYKNERLILSGNIFHESLLDFILTNTSTVFIDQFDFFFNSETTRFALFDEYKNKKSQVLLANFKFKNKLSQRIKNLIKLMQNSNNLLCTSACFSNSVTPSGFFSLLESITNTSIRIYKEYTLSPPIYDWNPTKFHERGLNYSIILKIEDYHDFIQMIPNNSLVKISCNIEDNIKDGEFKNNKGRYYLVGKDIKVNYFLSRNN